MINDQVLGIKWNQQKSEEGKGENMLYVSGYFLFKKNLSKALSRFALLVQCSEWYHRSPNKQITYLGEKWWACFSDWILYGARSISITWELVSNTYSQPAPRPAGSETLGPGPANCSTALEGRLMTDKDWESLAEIGCWGTGETHSFPPMHSHKAGFGLHRWNEQWLMGKQPTSEASIFNFMFGMQHTSPFYKEAFRGFS